MEFLMDRHLYRNQLKNQIMKTITFIAALFLTGITFAQNTFGDIIGTFTTSDKKEGIYGAYVITTRGDQVFKAVTNEDGRFRISAVPAGMYQVYFVTMEGDTTAYYIYKKFKSFNVNFSSIARGISVGDELEYADEVTLGRSILHRVPFENSLNR